MRRVRHDDGFSLVELLVVIIILGILAAIAVPALVNQRNKAYDASLRSDLRTVATAMEIARTADGELAVTHTDVAREGVTSPGNVVEVVISGRDYCLSARHGTSPRTWTFDTTAGGMGETSGGTCAGTVAFVLP
ncbi:type IV pilin protein [Cellulomonas sp. NS3]|uniref:type IV pilin protein n=1 Tax=Cellulomonas sp. NS3 TaxID=2973977 RepID=UPI002162A6F6|nr:prepilin-type N-terminal cleavage/methylation domain-containing protein [Cellulomonas sp. NS3]